MQMESAQTCHFSASVPGGGLPQARPCVKGKFLFIGDEKLYIRGVTYGTFRPDKEGCEFHSPNKVAQDFARMAESGINAVRIYTVPPRWMLDLAREHGLYVMVGLPWEQHITFLDSADRVRAIEQRVREAVRACAGHPAVLCYVIGNEIPALIVRWHGKRKIEKFLKRLYRAAKEEDPDGLVTYVNFPTTEYLQLNFVDFLCFNVYLESESSLEAYLARLQNIAGERPLVMAEIGLDSRRNGEEQQAAVLDWQIRTVFAGGCAGIFIFSWTDEWHRGGYDIEDWDFGLTTRDRLPKPALSIVRQAFAEVPFRARLNWPRVSVVVCSFNGQRTFAECLEELGKLDYPDYEVIVVDDGSTDRTAEIARRYPVRLISTSNHGLSAARNTGLGAATGEIIAYIDDDAYPDPQWLRYLAYTFTRTEHAGVGGPNIPPRGDGPIAECVANSPGGPVHVLVSDCEAEHIPGCNMAFRRSALESIGGFDAQFRAAGDDVDLCWRLQQKGWTLGFNPAAMVWHHRRNSVRNYWKQQKGYGKAEALLEKKWKEKYNRYGHVTWAGRLYGRGVTLGLRRLRIYHGTWGSSMFQSLYEAGPGTLASLPLMPEWGLINLCLALMAAAGTVWTPLLYVLPVLILSTGVPLIYVFKTVSQTSFAGPGESRFRLFAYRSLTAVLHVMQPVARLYGRLDHGLTPWRRRDSRPQVLPVSRVWRLWSEAWKSPESWLTSLETALVAQGCPVSRGGDFDSWDLLVHGGLLAAVRVRMAVEEHGAGKQLLLFRCRYAFSRIGLALATLFVALATVASLKHIWLAGAMLTAGALLLAAVMILECVEARSGLVLGLRELDAADLTAHAAAIAQPGAGQAVNVADRG